MTFVHVVATITVFMEQAFATQRHWEKQFVINMMSQQLPTPMINCSHI